MSLAAPSTDVGGGALDGGLTPRDQKCGSWLACDDGLPAGTYQPDTPESKMWELACLR